MTSWKTMWEALAYMFRPSIAVYWFIAGCISGIANQIWLQRVSDILGIVGKNDFVFDTNKIENLSEQLLQSIPEWYPLILIVLFLIIARSLDAAKQVSESNMDAKQFSPVGRIGWIAVWKYIGGTFIILLMSLVILIIGGILTNILLAIIGKLLGTVAVTIGLILSFLALIVLIVYLLYTSTLVFIQTLEFSTMITPTKWHTYVRKQTRHSLANYILTWFLLTFLLNFFIKQLTSTSSISIVLTAILGQFITMLSIIWIGFFIREHGGGPTQTLEEAARLLYDADTQDMTAEEKQRFVCDLQQADTAYSYNDYNTAIALLEPYIRHDAHAARYFPAYQRLYQWYPQDKRDTLQMRMIRFAALGNERFYQLIHTALLGLIQENHAQISANDIYPLAKLALAHDQPDIVLGLTENFVQQHAEHPDIVKVYECIIRAYLKQHQTEQAQHMSELVLAKYPEHADIGIIHDLERK